MLELRDRRQPGILAGDNEPEVPAALAVVDELMRGGSPPSENMIVVHILVKIVCYDMESVM